MAIAAGAVWEIRAAGLGASDANGGFYVSGGVDYSQQDAAQLAVSDAVANGTTTVTSAAGGFTSAMVGNGINIAGVCYQIAACTNTNTVTVDRIITTATGLTAKVGGACLTPGFVWGQAVGGNWVWAKGSTTLTSTTNNIAGGRMTLPSSVSASATTRFIGYTNTRGDGGKYTITNGALTSFNIVTSSGFCCLDNILLDCNSQTGASGFNLSSNVHAYSCRVTNITNGGGFGYATTFFCEVDGFVASSANVAFGAGTHYFASAKGTGFFSYGFQNSIVIGCIAIGFGRGFDLSFGCTALHCVAYGAAIDGFYFALNSGTTPEAAINCIAVNNSGWGFNFNGSNANALLRNCATYGNSSGGINTANLVNASLQNISPIALTANPFTNAAGNDFSLNNVSGGGKLCRGVAQAFRGLSTTGYPDLGAVQHQDAGGIIPVGMNGGIRG